jgi:hypothetical protein
MDIHHCSRALPASFSFLAGLLPHGSLAVSFSFCAGLLPHGSLAVSFSFCAGLLPHGSLAVSFSFCAGLLPHGSLAVSFSFCTDSLPRGELSLTSYSCCTELLPRGGLRLSFSFHVPPLPLGGLDGANNQDLWDSLGVSLTRSPHAVCEHTFNFHLVWGGREGYKVRWLGRPGAFEDPGWSDLWFHRSLQRGELGGSWRRLELDRPRRRFGYPWRGSPT